MNRLSVLHKTLMRSKVMPLFASRTLSTRSTGGAGDKPTSEAEPMEQMEECVDPPLPTYKERQGESLEVLKARLIYQSRKRGTLENGLILSTFAARYLSTMTPSQLGMYDLLINKPSNDWDIYYWIVGLNPVPKEYDNEVFALLQEHAKNKEKESRITLPDLLKH